METHATLRIDIHDHIMVKEDGSFESGTLELNGCPNCMSRMVAYYMETDGDFNRFMQVAYAMWQESIINTIMKYSGKQSEFNTYVVYKPPTEGDTMFHCFRFTSKAGDLKPTPQNLPLMVSEHPEMIYLLLEKAGLTHLAPDPGDDPLIIAVYI